MTCDYILHETGLYTNFGLDHNFGSEKPLTHSALALWVVKLSLRVANNLAIKERKWPLLSGQTCERTNTSFVYKRPRTGLEMNGNELLGHSQPTAFSLKTLSLFMTGGCLKKLSGHSERFRAAWWCESAKREIEMTLGTEFNPVLIYCCTLWYAAARAAIKRSVFEWTCLHSKSPAFITDAEMETRINSIFTRHKIMLWEDATPMLNGSCRAILLHLHIDTRCCHAQNLHLERRTLTIYL